MNSTENKHRFLHTHEKTVFACVIPVRINRMSDDDGVDDFLKVHPFKLCQVGLRQTRDARELELKKQMTGFSRRR